MISDSCQSPWQHHHLQPSESGCKWTDSELFLHWSCIYAASTVLLHVHQGSAPELKLHLLSLHSNCYCLCIVVVIHSMLIDVNKIHQSWCHSMLRSWSESENTWKRWWWLQGGGCCNSPHLLPVTAISEISTSLDFTWFDSHPCLGQCLVLLHNMKWILTPEPRWSLHICPLFNLTCREETVLR